MKKCILIVSAFLIAALAVAVVCAVMAPDPVLQGFSNYLDQEGLDPALAQWTLEESMEKYKYNGKPITELVGKMFYDGAYGGGKECTAEHFGYINDFRAETREDGQWARYSNTYYTDVELEGLEQPFDICFGDTLSEVFRKLNISMDPDEEFVSDRDNEGVMTLRAADGAVLKLTDNRRLPEESRGGKWVYLLEYAETYTSDHRQGRETKVTNTVRFLFDEENRQLIRLIVGVLEEYPMNP